MKKILTTYIKNNTFILFVLIGLLNTLFGYSLFAFFVFLGVHYSLAVLLATCFGVLFNFKTTGKIVFKNSDNKLLIKFIVVYIIQYIFNVALIKAFLLASLSTYLSGALATLICAFSAYLLSKNFVFKKVEV